MAAGYPEGHRAIEYDSVCTALDTELYKLMAFEMLDEAGVFVDVNTFLRGRRERLPDRGRDPREPLGP